MKSEKLFSKDFRVKYNSLAANVVKKQTIEDLTLSVDISQEELQVAKEVIHEEKKRSQEINMQLLSFKKKCEEIEKHNSSLINIVKDKDYLIEKL